MSVSQIKALAERVDALEARLAAYQEALVWAFGYARQPVPPGLRDESPQPDLRVIQGGAR